MQLIATDLYDNCKESKIIGTTRNSKSISKNITSDLDRYFITLAIEAVQVKHNLPLSIVEEQTKFKNGQESQFSPIQRV